jgi:hypothetical protein
MPDISKTLVRITVKAPERGKLGLQFDYVDGSSEVRLATVATIHKVLRDHGHGISAEALSRIAFCGHRLVLTSRLSFPGATSATTSQFN